ncbi:Patched family protein [Haloterrigena turkmenica DSM 5511]|uniref:Patched family protein n=1 Tax=Haloterrigena turkmenica (strain ATCC 51198 / DSM 5511 / JCM 9101 / NCIMB 13204 / VKM B-1734 / 4k) TaxID=543526 RepID=D2RXL0_HALTV|nr:MMPL family transporter [Haloterrigena turkmenica]ADB61734.1 Patched family protein [Haloterrigena turkmenica DSM 5511]
MSAPDRIADVVTNRSRIVIVVLLLLTAAVGAGMPMVEQSSSLDQFESESQEAKALERIQGNSEGGTDPYFATEGDENTTSVQVIVRGDGDNVLTRESLVSSLEFQQEIRNDDSINETLAENQSVTGVENLVAFTAISGDLAEREAVLETGLNDTLELQREYLNQTAAGEQEAAAETEAEINATIEQTAETAELDDDQTAEYEELVQQAREIESGRWEIEQETDTYEANEEYQNLTATLEQVRLGATTGIFEAEYTQLQEGTVPLADQIEALESLDDEAYERTVQQTLSDGSDGENFALALMPSSYEPGSTEAETRMTSVTQKTESDAAGGGMGGGAISDRIVDSQLEIRDLANAQEEDYIVFGGGIITDEIDRSMGDSLAIVGPFALLFVVVALLIAYRDLIDIVLGVVGIIAVLVWTFGFMGWADIAFNQMFVAVPVLLIGLSIDYAIHVFMRHREQREEDGRTGSVRGSMKVALAGVGAALLWVTATTVIGFLSNLVSPIGPIREFGIVSSVGIVAALIIFGALIPAMKVELDEFLESRGFDRRKRAFGTGGGRFSEVLTVGSTAARKAPLVVLVLVVLLSVGGVYGATQVDTSFQEEDFLAESPPAWTDNLPGGMSPGEYQAKDDLEFVNQHFQREDSQAQILVEADGGGVADPELLAELNETRDDAAQSDVVYPLANGDADVRDPLSTMESVAAQNESFNESFRAADTDGDGVPDENVSALYDQLFEVNEEAASQVLHRTDDDEYDAARMVIGIKGGASAADTTSEMRTFADDIEDGSDGRWTAIATGDPIVSHIVEQDLLNTVLESLLITLVAVFVFLSLAYYLTGDSAALGAVTLLPVAFTVSWILGTMYLIGMPFNVLTGMITSLTIGLGVAYSIHVSDRYTLELERQGNVWSALRTTVTGTGGALLGSAATTVGGFGTLAFAILPALRQFGIITGLTITYAFLASVIVLPSLLVLWTRYFGPDVSFDAPGSPAGTATASDGGRETETAMSTDARDGDDSEDEE